MERLINYQFIGALGVRGAAASGASRRREKACFRRPLAKKTPPRDAGGPSRKETRAFPSFHPKGVPSGTVSEFATPAMRDRTKSPKIFKFYSYILLALGVRSPLVSRP